MLCDWLSGYSRRDFGSAFKAPQRITHFKRLRECEDTMWLPVHGSLARYARPGKLGLLLFQLPPNFKADAERLAAVRE